MAFKILLADDSMTAQNLAKKILTDVGYDVVAVSNGAAAMKKISAERPDLLILDIYMPGYSGLEVCEKVKSASETASTPVLLTVAPMEPYNPADGNRVRADGVILKPFEARDLLPAVEKLQEQTASLRATSAPATAVQSKAAETAVVQDEASVVDQSSEYLPGERRPVPMPELPQEMAVAPAFGFEQFGDESAVSSQGHSVNIAELTSPAADPTEETFGALEIMEAELVSQSMKEFDLPEEGLQQSPEPESEPLTPPACAATYLPEEDSQEDSFPTFGSEFQSELEIDAANASLGEMGFASGLSPQMESKSSIDVDFSREAFTSGAPVRHGEQAVPEQDPELMVDRTQMVEFATRFGSDNAEEVPVGYFSGDEAELAYGKMEEQAEIPDEEGADSGFSPQAVSQEDNEEQGREFAQSPVQQQELIQEQEGEESQRREVEFAERGRVSATEAESAALPMVDDKQPEPRLEEEVEEAITPPAEFASAGSEEAEAEGEHATLPEMTSPQEPELVALEWNSPVHFANPAQFANEDERQFDEAFSPMDATQFFRSAMELEIPPDGSSPAGSPELDEHTLEEAVARVLDRLRPQILSEIVRELSHPRG